jgi:hypothetical protein
MTYKGIYRDGMVTLLGEVHLRNGDAVDVNLRGKSGSRRKASASRARTKKRARTRMTKAERLAAVLAARGTWKGRPEWRGKSSAEVSTELRRRASRRGRNG